MLPVRMHIANKERDMVFRFVIEGMRMALSREDSHYILGLGVAGTINFGDVCVLFFETSVMQRRSQTFL
jgi:hypothetical protein